MGNIFSGTVTDWGFGISDIWSSSMGIFATLAIFVVLGIVIAFAPKLMKLVRTSIFGGKEDADMERIRRMLFDGPVNYIDRVGNNVVVSNHGSSRKYKVRRK